jgi:membrane carboxypeptidase/penicillin-binding protein PbpC
MPENFDGRFLGPVTATEALILMRADINAPEF